MGKATGRSAWARMAWGMAIVCAIASPPAVGEGDATEWDRQLRESIEKRLLGQVELQPRSLKVEVSEGHVRLAGSVASLEERRKVEQLVLGFVEVRGVASLV